MKLLFGILDIKRGSVARGKVARGNVAARYCRRGSVARGNVRAVVSRNLRHF